MKDKKLVPKRRFKEFQNNDAWKQRKLSDVTIKVGSGKTPKGGSSVYKQFGIPLLRSQNIKNNRVNLQDVVYITQIMNEAMSNSLVMKNDVLLNITGASIGRSAVYNLTDPANVNQHVCIIRPNKEIDSNFIQLNLTSEKGQNQIEINQAGGAREGLNFQQIAKMNFAYPNYKEQQKIGNFFKHLDHMISLEHRKLEKTKNLKSAYLAEMLPAEGERLPKRRFKNYINEWQKMNFEQILIVNSGRDYKHLKKGSIPVYGTGGFMLLVDDKLSDVDAIGIGRKGTIDRPQLLKAPFWTVDTLFFLTPIKNIDLYFLYIISQTINWRKMDESTGVPSLSKTTIEKISISIPCLNEQQAIGGFFKKIDDSIANQQQKLNKLKAMKQAYLEEMFV